METPHKCLNYNSNQWIKYRLLQISCLEKWKSFVSRKNILRSLGTGRYSLCSHERAIGTREGGGGVAQEGVAGAAAPGGETGILRETKMLWFELNKFVFSQTK